MSHTSELPPTQSCALTALQDIAVAINHWLKVARAAPAHHLGDIVDVGIDACTFLTLWDGGQACIRVGDRLQQ